MKEIKGTTRVCGLIGNPVGHSISPLIHNTIAELEDIQLAYVTFQVEKENVAKAVEGAYALNIQGLNVTVPHKNSVISTLTDIDPIAKSIGAVNTLVRTKDGYKGYNTDILGFHRELTEAGITLKDQEVIILGAGGAARAIAFLCGQEQVAKLWILNRTVEKAKNIADAVNETFKRPCAEALPLAEYQKLAGRQYITIQTTSVGLHPHDEEAVIDEEAFYKMVSVGIDIIYNPAKTKFMKYVEKQNKKAYNGLKMLLYQGVSAFELWNNMKVSDEVITEVYKAMKKELGIIEQSEQ